MWSPLRWADRAARAGWPSAGPWFLYSLGEIEYTSRARVARSCRTRACTEHVRRTSILPVDLLLQIRVALDTGLRLCRFRSGIAVENSDGIRRDHAVMFARNRLPASARCRFVESTLVEIGDGVGSDQVVTVPA